MIYGIFTKPIHVEKLASFLGTKNIDFIISTRRDAMYRKDFDIGISYCYPYIVDTGLDKRPWYNYHPAPLPEYPSLSCLSSAINERVNTFGVTLHNMTKQVDGGSIVKKKMFKLMSIPVDFNELGCITHYYLFQLFKETVEDLGKRRHIKMNNAVNELYGVK